MKNFVLCFVLCFGLSSCSTVEMPKEIVKEEIPAPAPVITKVEPFKSWPNQQWAKLVYDFVVAHELEKISVSDGKKFCPNGMTRRNWVHLLGAMAKHESGFKPTTTFQENFKDNSGAFIISTGLFQISRESTQSTCGKSTQEMLKDPLFNIECTLKLVKKFVAADKVLSGSSLVNGKTRYYGLAKYWAVMRGNLMETKTKKTLAPFCE